MAYTLEEIQAAIDRKEAQLRSSQREETPESSAPHQNQYSLEEIQAAIDRKEAAAEAQKGFGEKALDVVKDLPRNAAQVARSVAAGVGGALDLPLLPIHLGMMAAGKEPMFVSEGIKKGIDYVTNDALKPRSTLGKALEGGIEAVAGLKPTGSMMKGALSLIKPQGKAAKIATKPLEWIEKGSELTRPNIAATGAAGSVLGAASDSENVHPLSAMALSLIAGAAAHKTANAIKSGGVRAVVAGNPGAALRFEKIGKPYKENLGKNLQDIAQVNPEEVGSDVMQAAEKYHAHHNRIFNRKENYVGKHTKNVQVNLTEPLQWSLNKITNARDPAEMTLWMESPLGKETIRLLGVPKKIKVGTKTLHTGTDPYALMGYLEANPQLVHRTLPFQSALSLRRALDNTLSMREFAMIGDVDKGQIEHMRNLMNQTMQEQLKHVDRKTHKIMKDYHTSYATYAKEKIPLINELRLAGPFPGDIYTASKKDISKFGYKPKFALEALEHESHPSWWKNLNNKKEKGGNASQYSKSILRDIGREGENIDIEKLQKGLANLEEAPRQMLLKSLPEADRVKLETQLKRYKGYEETLGNVSPADIAFRNHGIGWWHTLTNKTRQHLLKNYWASEKGQKRLHEYVENLHTPEAIKKDAAQSSLKHMYTYQSIPRGVEYRKGKRKKEEKERG